MNTLRGTFERQASRAGTPDLDIDELVGLGERRLRRRQLAAVLGSVTAVLVAVALVIGGATLIGLSKGPTRPIDKPSPSPSPTHTERSHGDLHPPKGLKKLTPRQTVQSYNAQLIGALASFDDPDVRMAVWATECLVCPPLSGGRGPQGFFAMAVTDDGFRTATYLRPHVLTLDSILSVSRDTFLLVDPNSLGKLLGADGTLRSVRMVDETRTPDDPRSVFRCGGDDLGPGNGWCVLDVATATAARLPATFTVTGRSAGDPALGQRPWGAEAMALPPYRAWWDDGGIRRTSDLAQPFQVVPSLSKGDDTPTYVRWRPWSHRLDVFAVEDGAARLTQVGSRPWLPVTRDQIAEVGRPKEVGLVVEYARMPDGGLLAWSDRGTTRRTGLSIWRAPSLTSGAFEVVYEGPPYSEWDLGYDPRLVLHHGRLHLDRLVSDDDGRTWTEPVTEWR